MPSFFFPIEFNGRVTNYPGQILIGRNHLNQEVRKIRVVIQGVDLIYKLDKEGKLFDSVLARGKNDPQYKRASMLSKALRIALLKSLKSYLLSNGNVKLNVRTAPIRHRHFKRL